MLKGLKILHILPSISPETGGPSISVRQICHATSKIGNRVTLYTTLWPRREPTLFPNGLEKSTAEYTINIFSSEPNSLVPDLPYSPALIKAVCNHYSEFDMVVCHSLWNPLITFAMRVLRRVGATYCIMPHGMLDPIAFRRNRWKKSPWAFLWERSNVERASLIIFNTDAEREKARRSGWVFRQTFILPHLIDLNSWKILPHRSTFETSFPEVRGCEVILFVGRINWVKNLDKLVDALAIVRQKKPCAMLVCVGPDSDGHRGKLEQQARGLGLQDNILFPGMLEGEQLKTAYARSNVFALVSKKENFGLVVAEALASGLPVVISQGVDVGKNWVSEGPVRRVAPTPEEIAKALVDLLERSKKRGLPDLDARAFAEKEWSESKILELINAYRSVLSRKEL